MEKYLKQQLEKDKEQTKQMLREENKKAPLII